MDLRTPCRWLDTTLIEPLVDRWPAWSYLLSPLPAARHAAEYQIPVLRSYLADPESHIAASRDPELFGGPWVDVPIARVDDVRRLLAEMESRRKEALHFGSTFIDYHRQLVTRTSGESLEPYYRTLPPSLRGLVELVYDYFDRPFIRAHEALLYRTPLYDESLQSFRLSRLENEGDRPFFMSTPRLPSADAVDWPVAFRDGRVDELYGLDRRPRPFGEVLELLGLRESDAPRVRPLVTAAPRRLPEPWRGEHARIRYIGHACALIESRGATILVDPVVPVRPFNGGRPRLSFDDLPDRIDFAIVTHNHQDHFSLETLLRLRSRVGCLIVPKTGFLYGDLSLRLLARTLGFPSVVELDELETMAFPGGGITAAPFHGEHGDLAHGKNGYIVQVGEARAWFAADSDCLDRRLYERVREACGPVDALFIGTESVGGPLAWTNGPLFPVKPEQAGHLTRRYHGCGARTALELAEASGTRAVFAYAMGLEPWMDHLLGLGMNENAPQWIESEKLLLEARQRGYVADRLDGPRDLLLEPAAGTVRSAPAQRPAVVDNTAHFQL